jgi:hypothetical protein
MRFLSTRLGPARGAPTEPTMAGGPHAPGQAGAPPNHRKRKAPVPAAAAGDEAETEVHTLGREVEELEESLAELDRRVLEHLRGTATRLADAAVDRLAALRPPGYATPSSCLALILGFGTGPPSCGEVM